MENRACALCSKAIRGDRANRTRCQSCNTKIRRARIKQAAIRYLGGACVKCGFAGHPAAFDFHHRDDGRSKEFAIGRIVNRSWEVVRAELDKCDLLCANCHREEHSTRTEAAVLAAVLRYRGRSLAL